MATIKKYYKLNSQEVLLFSDKKYPTFSIAFDPKDNKYHVFSIRTRVLTKVRMDSVRGSNTDTDLLSIIVSLNYPDELVDKLAKIHKYPNIFTYAKLAKNQLFKYITVENVFDTTSFIKCFGPLEIETLADSDDDDVEKIENLTVFFPSSMRKTTRDKFRRVLTDLSNLYKKHGMFDAIRGPVRFTNVMKAYGSYYPDSKEVRIKSSIDDYLELLYVLVHEYAHYYMYNVIPNRQGEIIKIFNEKQIENQVNKEVPIKIGDKIKYVGSKKDRKGVWAVSDIMGSKIKLKFDQIEEIHLTINSSPDIIKKAKSGYYAKKQIVNKDHIILTGPHVSWTMEKDHLFSSSDFEIEGEIRKMGIDKIGYSYQQRMIPNYKTSLKFPTKYSEKNYKEWFAECMTLYIFDCLEGDIKNIMQSFSKR